MSQPPSPPTAPQPDPESEATGLPAVPSWRGVYLAVTGVFILYVVLLTTLMKVYS
jgi:hypothetical protein